MPPKVTRTFREDHYEWTYRENTEERSFRTFERRLPRRDSDTSESESESDVEEMNNNRPALPGALPALPAAAPPPPNDPSPIESVFYLVLTIFCPPFAAFFTCGIKSPEFGISVILYLIDRSIHSTFPDWGFFSQIYLISTLFGLWIWGNRDGRKGWEELEELAERAVNELERLERERQQREWENIFNTFHWNFWWGVFQNDPWMAISGAVSAWATAWGWYLH